MGTSNAPLAGSATVVPAALAAPGQEGRVDVALPGVLRGSCPDRARAEKSAVIDRHLAPSSRGAPTPTTLVAVVAFALAIAVPGRAEAQSNEELLGIIRDQQRQIEELSRRLERVEERSALPPPTAAAPAPAPSNLELSWAPSPTLRSADGLFEAHLRGRLFVDGGFLDDEDNVYDTRATELRAARLGIEGTAWRDFGYRLEVDFADDEVDITDAYVEYDGSPIEPAYVRVGQFKTPNSLEEQTSSRFITFMERAGFTDAFDLNRRIGVQVGAGTDDWSLAGGIFGQNAEEVSEDEGYAAAARGSYAFRFGGDQLLHVGGSTRYRELDNDSDDGAVQYRQRPFFHFTNIYSVDTGEVDDADSDLFFGGETALVRGAFSLQAEAAHTWLNRGGADNVHGLWGGYVSASYFLTGESRAYDGEDGTFDRVRPEEPLHEGGPGAWEVAARVDYLDLDGNGLDVSAGKQASYIAGVNWHPNANMRLMLNGAATQVEDAEDSPGVVGESNTIYGLGMRAQVDF